MAINGVFTPVLAKHSKSFSLIDCIAVGVDRMQRDFEPMRKQVETGQGCGLTDVTAKVVIYEAFVEGKLEAPKHLAPTVHDLYFEPKYEEFQSRTIWSTRSRRRSRNWIRFHNSKRPPNWASFSRLDSHSRSDQFGGAGRTRFCQSRTESLKGYFQRNRRGWVYSRNGSRNGST